MVREADLAHPDRLDRIWEDLFAPPLGRWIRESTAQPVNPAPSVELEGDGLVFSSCLSGAERGELLLRCFNQLEQPVQGAWWLSLPVVRARRMRADGTVTAQLSVDQADAQRVRFSAGKREIVTVAVLLAPSP